MKDWNPEELKEYGLNPYHWVVSQSTRNHSLVLTHKGDPDLRVQVTLKGGGKSQIEGLTLMEPLSTPNSQKDNDYGL